MGQQITKKNLNWDLKYLKIHLKIIFDDNTVDLLSRETNVYSRLWGKG